MTDFKTEKRLVSLERRIAALEKRAKLEARRKAAFAKALETLKIPEPDSQR